MSKNYKSHKRQKSSLSNIGYFIPESPSKSDDLARLPHNVSQSQPPTPLRSPIRPKGRAQSLHQLPESLQLEIQPQLGPSSPSITHSTSHHSPVDHSVYESTGDYSSYFHPPAQPSAYNYQMPYNSDRSYQQFPGYTDYSFPKPDRSKHKANLSISSHFNMFNLNEPMSMAGPMAPQHPPPQLSQMPPQLQPPVAQYAAPAVPVAEPPPGGSLLDDLVRDLTEIDSSSVNNFLLSLIHKVQFQPPLDDFYNLLYNSQVSLILDTSAKLDKTDVSPESPVYSSLDLYNNILDVFKNPEKMVDYFPDLKNKENKLSNINYHELLRTFLAVKILSDMLIQLPSSSSEEFQNNNIPRLSLYKTYFIICQRLLLKYPSSDAASNEHHKLILGQSKLGKLIKLVYPDMLIKRLGSRGESKYNYLGVVWNEQIVNEEIKSLCDKYELSELSQYFESPNRVKLERLASVKKEKSPKKIKQEVESVALEDEIMPPRYSFVTNDITFPNSFNSIQSNWINSVKFDILSQLNLPFDLTSIVEDVFLQHQTDLVFEFNTKLVEPLSAFNLEKIDLRLYSVILLEFFPYFISIKDYDTLKVLKLNILSLIENSGSVTAFPRPSTNAFTVFLLLLKKLINLNDSLLSLIKVNLNPSLGKDIEQLFDSDLDFFTNNLIQSLVSYNFNSSANVLNLSFIDNEINQFKKFFLNDLLGYLNNHRTSDDDSTFNQTDYTNLMNLLNLVDSLFNNIYPIQIFVNFFDLTSNDLLKVIYFKNFSNFNSWWMLNYFLQEYLSLVGELVGLHNALN